MPTHKVPEDLLPADDRRVELLQGFLEESGDLTLALLGRVLSPLLDQLPDLILGDVCIVPEIVAVDRVEAAISGAIAGALTPGLVLGGVLLHDLVVEELGTLVLWPVVGKPE